MHRNVFSQQAVKHTVNVKFVSLLRVRPAVHWFIFITLQASDFL